LTGNDCSFYVADATGWDDQKVNEQCDLTGKDFLNVTDMKLYVNGTWYGEYYKSDVMANLGFNEE
jgi:hypothetical protein